MKKMILIAFLIIGTKSIAQVTKADFDAIIAVFPQSGYEYVYMENKRTFYTDGTSAITQDKYYANKVTIEPAATSVYLRFYTDETKSKVNDILIIPYIKIDYIEAFDKGLVITLAK